MQMHSRTSFDARIGRIASMGAGCSRHRTVALALVLVGCVAPACRGASDTAEPTPAGDDSAEAVVSNSDVHETDEPAGSGDGAAVHESSDDDGAEATEIAEAPDPANVRGGPNWRGHHSQPSGHGLLVLVSDHLAVDRYDEAAGFWCTWRSWSFDQLVVLQKELMANDANPGELGAWVRMTRCTRVWVAELRDSLALTVAGRCPYVMSICGETDDCRYLESQCYTTLGDIGDDVLRERAFEYVRNFEGPYREYTESWESRLVVDAARYLSGCCSDSLEYRREMTRLFERASFGRSLSRQQRTLVPLVEDE